MPAPVDGARRRRRRRKEGLTSDERAELVELRRAQPGAGDGDRDPQAGLGLLRPGERPPKMVTPLVQRAGRGRVPRRGDLPGAEVSHARGTTSGSAGQPSARAVADAELIDRDHRQSTPTPAAPTGRRGSTPSCASGWASGCGRKRVARLMRAAGTAGRLPPAQDAARPAGAGHRTRTWCSGDFTADGPGPALVHRHHPAPRRPTGWVYCCAVVDAYSRRVVGWSIADHLRTELVVDALEMARWQRTTRAGTVVHSDRGTQYTSWVFGTPAAPGRPAGLDGPGRLRVDNALIESFFAPCRRELLDRQHLDHPGRAGLGDLRVDRGLVQPPPAPLRPGIPVPARVRNPSHRHAHRGMITTPTPSGETGSGFGRLHTGFTPRRSEPRRCSAQREDGRAGGVRRPRACAFTAVQRKRRPGASSLHPLRGTPGCY